MTILNVGLSLGPLAAGLLLQYAGATTAVFAFSAVIAAAGLGALSSRAVRAARWPETKPAPVAEPPFEVAALEAAALDVAPLELAALEAPVLDVAAPELTALEVAAADA
jgi:MFS family permease